MRVNGYLFSVAVAALVSAAAGTAVVIGGNDDPQSMDGRPRGAFTDQFDPTAIPTLTPPARFPDLPVADPTSRPAKVLPETKSLPAPPTAETVRTRDGKYEAIGDDGCVWAEERRVKSPDSGGKRVVTEVILTSPCTDDMFAVYTLETGEITLTMP